MIHASAVKRGESEEEKFNQQADVCERSNYGRMRAKCYEKRYPSFDFSRPRQLAD
jgi:hypothetical protein